MEIYINTEGSYLRKRNELFEFESNGEKTRISPKRVERILISVHAMLTSDSIELALMNNIDIVLLDRFGEPLGRFWHARFGSTAAIRRGQLLISESPEGLEFAKAWIHIKNEKAAAHINKLGTRRKTRAVEIAEWINMINKNDFNLMKITGKGSEERGSIMGYEGTASRVYYLALSRLLSKDYRFNGRSSRPAHDWFNCALNYGFGILYSRTERAQVIAGLDPFLGLLHTDNYNKTSLVYDMCEAFRYMVIEPIYKLFTRKMVKKDYFDKVYGGFTLNKAGKEVVVSAVTESFGIKILYRGRKLSQIDTLQAECHRIANLFIEKER